MKRWIPNLSLGRFVLAVLLVSLSTAAVEAQTIAPPPDGIASGFLSSELSSGPSEEVVAAFEEGKRLFGEERYDEAIGWLTRAINGDAGGEGLGAAPIILRAKAYFELKEYTEAEVSFNGALAIERNSAEALNGRGETYQELGNASFALDDFRSAVQLDRQNKDYLYNLGAALSALFTGPEVIEAEKRLTSVIEVDDQMTKAFSARAGARSKLGKHEEAIADYRRAIELEPTEKEHYLNLGTVFAQQEELELAIQAFSKAFEVYSTAKQAAAESGETEPEEPEPVFVAPLLNRAQFLIAIAKKAPDEAMRAEAYDRAAADCDLTIQMVTDEPSQRAELSYAHFQRGIIYEEREQYEEAVRSFTEALKINPGNAGAYTRRGIVWFQLGDYALALTDLDEAVQINPADRSAHLYRGFTLVRQEKYREAIAAYTKALVQDGQYVPALNNRGLAYVQDGQFGKAIEDFNQMLLINPKDATAYFKRGVTYLLIEDYDNAVTALSGATRLDPSDAMSHEKLGDAYALLGQTGEAQQYRAEAARLRQEQGVATP